MSVHKLDKLERLREFYENSFDFKSEAISIIAKVFQTDAKSITDISLLKKGMTNRSFKFKLNNKYYIMRIPGEGTDQIIDRRQEYEVYKMLEGLDLCDNVIYINPDNGYKITEFLEEAKVCDPDVTNEVQLCMDKLRSLHQMKLKVNHQFYIFSEIENYESLRLGLDSVYPDYSETKSKMYQLKEYIDSIPKESVLCHIDSVADNFLLTGGEVRLIDWEYSGMQDPHIDIAMFAIYSLYDKEQIDDLIDMYFTDVCEKRARIKIYCYISVCGFLWSNWCEYKRIHGVEFGEYSIRQYRYAKDFYKIAIKEMKNL